MKKILLLVVLLVGVSMVSVAQNRDREEERRQAYLRKHIEKPVTYQPTWFEYLVDGEQSLGASYNYGKGFPFGVSINYSYSLFMASLDFGINMDKDKYETIANSVVSTNTNVKETTTLDPKYFVTITPSLYFKYISIGCGIGGLCLKSNQSIETTSNETENYGYSTGGTSVSGSASSSSSSTQTNSSEKFKFMIRPSIKVFIPLQKGLQDVWSLSLHAGYDYAFDFKEKNGFNFGAGVQYSFY